MITLDAALKSFHTSEYLDSKSAQMGRLFLVVPAPLGTQATLFLHSALQQERLIKQ